MQDDTTTLTTLEPGQQPTAKQLIRELQEAMLAACSMDVFDRLLRCAETRKCEWAGKPPDGRLAKTKEKADERKFLFRWPGAPDVSVPLADTLIRWLRMIRMAVFNRGDARISPERLPESADSSTATTAISSLWQLVTTYYLHKQDRALAHAFGLFSTCVEEFGYCIMLIDWQKKRRLEHKRMSLQQITDALVKQRITQVQQVLEGEGAGLMDEDSIFSGVSITLQDMLLSAEVTPEHLEIITLTDSAILPGEARRVIHALREDRSQEAAYTVPRDDGGQLSAKTFIPWVNCIHPHDLSATGGADWIGYPEYYSLTQLKEAALLEGWDKALTEQLIQTQENKFFHEGFSLLGVNVPPWACNGVGIGLAPDNTALQHTPRYQVFYVYRKVTNSQGLPMVYKAVVHPYLEDGLLLWQPTDMEDLSIIVETSEDVTHAMLARGVPDIVVDKQNLVKDGMDGEGARAQLGSNPPFVRNSGTHIGMRPGLEIDGGKVRNDLSTSRFVGVPRVDQGTFKLMDMARQLAREYYFCAPDTPPDDKRLFVEDLSFRSLRCMVQMIRLIWRQIQENISQLHVSHIAGRPVQLSIDSRDQLKGEADVHVGFHVDGLSKDASERFFDMLTKLTNVDRAGRADWGEITQIAVQLFAPTYARRIIVPAEQASQNILTDQDTRIAKIMAGVPMEYAEQISGPEMRMQRMQQWLTNAENQALVQASATRLELVQKELQWLQTRQQQQVENPVIGRTGVSPNA